MAPLRAMARNGDFWPGGGPTRHLGGGLAAQAGRDIWDTNQGPHGLRMGQKTRSGLIRPRIAPAIARASTTGWCNKRSL